MWTRAKRALKKLWLNRKILAGTLLGLLIWINQMELALHDVINNSGLF
jgi:hypothetical protein